MVCFAAPRLFAQPADAAVLQQLSRQGEQALTQNRYGEAEAAYEKLRQLSPQIAEIHAKLGLIYFQQRKYPQAIPVLRHALKLKPALPNADVLLAMALSETGRYSEAVPGLLKGFRGSGDAALKRMTGLQLQRSYTALRADNKAAEVALELTRLYPEDPEILYHTGRVFGNFAFVTMRKLADVAPTSTWKQQASAEVFESQGSYDLALAAYRQVLTSDPRRPGVHFRIGRTLLLRSRQPDAPSGSAAEATREFEQELSIDPTNANAAYELGEIRRREGRLDEARDLFGLALKHHPDFREAHAGLARALLAMKNPQAALTHGKRSVELDPDDAVSHFHLAQVYRALGNTDEQHRALSAFRRLREQQQEREKLSHLFSPQEVTKQELGPEAVQ